jgi:hypothetical protein
MRIRETILTALCFLFVNQPTAFATGTVLVPGTENSPEIRIPDGIPMPSDPAGASICRRDEAGFLIRLPDGWQNIPDAANHFNLCFMAVSNGTNFNDAPAVVYPRIFVRSPGRSPADAADNAAQIALKALARAPGGENISLRVGESFTTPPGLPVEIRYFDNGPYPNVFEAVTYVTYDTAVLGLILSAKTREARDTFLPVLLKSAREVYPIQIKDKRKNKRQD